MELYFNMFKIRYLVLDELLKDIEFEKGEEINIFINLETVLKKIINTIEDKENILSGPKRNLLLTSCVFNLIAHYRNYFNKHMVCSKVYIFGPENMDSQYLNRNYIEDYRKDVILLNMTKSTSIGHIYSHSIKIMKNILEYVEGVYFITSGIIEPSVVPLIVTEDLGNEKNKNFLISDDKYDYQYIKENFFILKPRMDKSMLITSDNVMEILKEKTKCTYTTNPHVNFIPFILSILGDNYRSIPKVKRLGISTIYKLINSGIKNNKINENVTSISSLNQIVDAYNQNQIALNYLCTNVREQQKRLSNTDIIHIKNQLIDKYDGGYLRNLNDEYFIEFPLNIIEITRGIKNKKFSKISWK